MSNGNFVFKPAIRRENGIQTNKNRVTTAEKTLCLARGRNDFGRKGCLKLSTPFKK
jgi:hypothetical protein